MAGCIMLMGMGRSMCVACVCALRPLHTHFFTSSGLCTSQAAILACLLSMSFMAAQYMHVSWELGYCRSQLLEFYASSGDFTRRLTSVKANGKFSSPSAGAQDYWTVSGPGPPPPTPPPLKLAPALKLHMLLFHLQVLCISSRWKCHYTPPSMLRLNLGRVPCQSRETQGVLGMQWH